jgi:putative ABC transport system permease protein
MEQLHGDRRVNYLFYGWRRACMQRRIMLWKDARLALRALARTPGYFTLALLTLTLGVATATVLFSVTESILWRPLPFPDSGRLMLIAEANQRQLPPTQPASMADFLEWRASAQSFSQLAAMGYGRPHNIVGLGFGERINANAVSANFFDVLGARPAAGRAFRPAEERGGARVIILTDGFWRTRLGGRNVLGESVKLDGEPYVIAGIMPSGFHLEFIPDPDVFLPANLSATADRTHHDLAAIGRLKPGVTARQAEAEMRAIAARIAAAHPETNAYWSASVEDLRDAFIGNSRYSLLLFLGFSVFVLLIACANVAGLQLVRHAGRQREFALRTALGASRRALLRQSLAESAWIALPGGIAGALLASWGLEGLRAILPPGEFFRNSEIRMEPAALVFVLAASIAAMLIFALAPGVSRVNLQIDSTLRDGGKTVAPSPGSRRRLDGLIGAEVALAFLLLFAAGLFVRSHASLLSVPLGFDPEHVFALRMLPGGAAQPSPAQSRDYYGRALETVRVIPGVTEAALASGVPLTYPGNVRFRAANQAEDQNALARAVTPSYFHLMHIPLLAGRGFTDRDSAGAAQVAIVNENLARRVFGGENPVGRELVLLPDRQPVEIVGVAANTKELGLDEVVFNAVYLPFAQHPSRSMYLAVKSGADPTALAAVLRAKLRELDAEVSISSAATMEERVQENLRGARFHMALVAVFAALAVLLASVGVYGALAFSVAHRTREFGLRMALGARPSAILRLSLIRAVRLTAAGAVCGLASALALDAVLRDALFLVPGKHTGLLHGVTLRDPASLLGSMVLLAALAALAALVPSVHAARLDPAIALRHE